MNLINYSKNIYSQNGEDGIIQEIIRRLDICCDNSQWCVEFGAWDGKHLANTFLLVEQGVNAIYIEGDKERYKDLLQTVKQYPHITPINAYVDRCAEQKIP